MQERSVVYGILFTVVFSVLYYASLLFIKFYVPGFRIVFVVFLLAVIPIYMLIFAKVKDKRGVHLGALIATLPNIVVLPIYLVLVVLGVCDEFAWLLPVATFIPFHILTVLCAVWVSCHFERTGVKPLLPIALAIIYVSAITFPVFNKSFTEKPSFSGSTSCILEITLVVAVVLYLLFRLISYFFRIDKQFLVSVIAFSLAYIVPSVLGLGCAEAVNSSTFLGYLIKMPPVLILVIVAEYVISFIARLIYKLIIRLK